MAGVAGCGAAVGRGAGAGERPGEKCLALLDVSAGYAGRTVCEHVSLAVRPGEVHCLMGPNGAGKTTLFRSALGLMPLLSGRVEVDGQDAAAMSDCELARVVAYVPQAAEVPFAFSVRDVVVMGRVSRLGAFSSPGRADYEAADASLEALGIRGLAGRSYTELSGGERQMVLIARAFAQGPRYVLMDEPTAALDLGNRARVLSQVRRLAAEGIGVLMTTHTPDHLSMCGATGTLLLPDGTYVQGTADDLLRPELLSRAYGTEVMVVDAGGQRFCRPRLEGLPASACHASNTQRMEK